MAKFWPAFVLTLAREGGYKLYTNPNDTGGMTFAGISRKWHGDWVGWQYVDKGERKSRRLRTEVANFYIREFWRPLNCSKIESQEKAETIFDFGVNANWDTAASVAQACVGAKIDGEIGPLSIAAINAANEESFFKDMYIGKMVYYADVVKRNHRQKPNHAGWSARGLDVLGARSNGYA